MWVDAPAFDGNASILGYLVELETEGQEPRQSEVPPSDPLSVTITGLENGRTYTARAAAVNEAGTGEWSQRVATVLAPELIVEPTDDSFWLAPNRACDPDADVQLLLQKWDKVDVRVEVIGGNRVTVRVQRPTGSALVERGAATIHEFTFGVGRGRGAGTYIMRVRVGWAPNDLKSCATWGQEVRVHTATRRHVWSPTFSAGELTITPSTPPTPVPTATGTPVPQAVTSDSQPTDFALRFDGVDDFAKLPDASMAGVGGAMTVEAWMLWEGAVTAPNPIIVNKGTYELGVHAEAANQADRGHLAYALQIGGQWLGRTDLGTSTRPERDTPTGWRDAGAVIADGRWHHVAVTFDGITARAYVDGRLADEKQLPGTIDSSASPLYFGARPDWGPPEARWRGLLDEVRVWQRALAPGEIWDAMNGNIDLSQSDLLAYWDFNDGPGLDRAVDGTGKGNDAVLGSASGPDPADPAWVASSRASSR